MHLLKLCFILLFLLISEGFSLSKGKRSYIHKSENIKLKVWYNVPRKVPQDAKILFVLHGFNRDARDYRDSWLSHSEAKNFILIVPEFSDRDFPGSYGYNLANMYSKNGKFNPKDKWSFSIIENIFLHLKKEFKLSTENYFMYGHSAGAQFVHRFVMFYPEASLKMAIAANAGWYTIPNKDLNFPYGTKNVPPDLESIFKNKLTLLLGDKDI